MKKLLLVFVLLALVFVYSASVKSEEPVETAPADAAEPEESASGGEDTAPAGGEDTAPESASDSPAESAEKESSDQPAEEEDLEVGDASEDAGETKEEKESEDSAPPPPPPKVPKPQLPYSIPAIEALFLETFDNSWESRWVKSQDPKYTGNWKVGKGTQPGVESEQGLLVMDAARHHAIAAKFPKLVVPAEKGLVVQYEVRFHKHHTCGGAYLKLLSANDSFDVAQFKDDTPYTIMFGPDRCGETDKVHFIFRHKNPLNGIITEKHLSEPPRTKNDLLTHMYTLVVYTNNSYAVYIDKVIEKTGSLLEDFNPAVNPPATVPDPTDLKPADWVDEETIPDANDKKPDDWDKPENIPDPDAKKPEDWNDETDGVWEPPQIPNPDFKGEWAPKKIPNPAYKGPFVPRSIPNPDFYNDTTPYAMTPIMGVGIELWTMSELVEFDNILIDTDLDKAFAFADKTWGLKQQMEDFVDDTPADKKSTKKTAGDGFLDVLREKLNLLPIWAIPAFTVVVGAVIIAVFIRERKPTGAAAAAPAGAVADSTPAVQAVVKDEKDKPEAAESKASVKSESD